MKTTLEGKASEKGTDRAIFIKSIGVMVMFSCFGIAVVLLVLK